MLSESTFAQFNFELQGHIGALGNADDQGASDIPALSHPQRAALTTFKKMGGEKGRRVITESGGSCCLHITIGHMGAKCLMMRRMKGKR